jgi:Lon protease-like protein
MHLPLFPLNTVLFPGMMLPLNIFEPRYLEMISHCVETKSPFGVVLIREGREAGGGAVPHEIGSAARIMKTKNLPDGRMHIVAVGTQRFKIESLDYNSQTYLSAEVSLLPFRPETTPPGAPAVEIVKQRIFAYVDLISAATNTKMRLERVPDDPKAIAFLVASALQVDNHERQRLLETPGVPELLMREQRLLSRELLLMRHMVDTQSSIMQMGMGPTGYIFPN